MSEQSQNQSPQTETPASPETAAWAPTAIDREAEALIKQIEADAEFGEPDVQASHDSSPAVPVGSPPPTPTPTGAPAPSAAKPAGDDLEARVSREVGLRDLENRLKAREDAIAKREAELTAGPRVPEWADTLDIDPLDALVKAGRDPDQMVRRLIAKKLEASGKPVPPELQASIATNDKEILLNRKIAALEAKVTGQERESAARAFFEQVQTEARAYVTKGVGEYAPTVGLVAKQDPSRVTSEILEEISQDARMKAARDPNLPLMTFEEAAKRVEARWSPLRTALSGGSPSEASTSPKLPVAGQSVTPSPSAAPATKPPAAPLQPWLQKSDLEEEGIREAMAEYKKLIQASRNS